MNLRPYQADAVESVFQEWKEVRSTLGVLATGGGKSLIAAEVIKRIQPKRAMFLCHREELIFQFRQTVQNHTGLQCGIEMAESYVNNSLFGEIPVIVATVQTLNSKFGGRTRMSRFKPQDFGVLVIDEVHHATSKSYKNVINYFSQNPDLKILGITATPDRSDEEALGQVCDSVAFDIEILDLIHDGYLVPVDQQFVSVGPLDYSHIRTTAGDLNNADLAAVMEAEENLQGMAGSLIQIIGNRRTIVFTASVKQAEMMSSIFNRHRPGMSDWVCGATNKDDRRVMLSKFQDGTIQVVCNCGVLTEGFDNPSVEVIGMCRPTKSRSLYAQMAGRSTRSLPGIVDGFYTPDERKAAIAGSPKPCCLIVDFVGNSGKHKLMSSADILGGKVSDAACERAVKMAQKTGKPVRMSEALDDAEEEIREMQRQHRLAEEARKARLVAKVTFTSKSVNAFDIYDVAPIKERGWDNGRTLSEKERNILRKFCETDPDSVTYAQGKQLVGEQCRRFKNNLCTLRQAKTLKGYGYETKDMTKPEAHRLIDALSKNGWRRLDRTTNVPLLTKPKEDLPF